MAKRKRLTPFGAPEGEDLPEMLAPSVRPPIADMAGAFNLQLARSVVEKMVFNRRRKDHTHAGRLQSGGKAY